MLTSVVCQSIQFHLHPIFVTVGLYPSCKYIMLGTYFFQVLRICSLFFLSKINVVVFIYLEWILPVIKFSHPILTAEHGKRSVMWWPTHALCNKGNNHLPGCYPNKDWYLLAFSFQMIIKLKMAEQFCWVQHWVLVAVWL